MPIPSVQNKDELKKTNLTKFPLISNSLLTFSSYDLFFPREGNSF